MLVVSMKEIFISAFAGFFFGALTVMLYVFRQKPQRKLFKRTAQLDGLIGSYGLTITDIVPDGPLGRVEVHGTLWNAEAFESVPKGTRVIIAGRDNLNLTVQRV
jgi:membrane protein implicated in regulation of membrane protease activity